MIDVPETLTDVLGAFDRAAVGWALLRPPASLTLGEGDVDLLVAPEHLVIAERILDESGFVLLPLPGPDVHGATFDRKTDRFVWVHVQSSLRLAGAELDAAAVLAEAVREDGVSRAGDNWMLWILLLRALVDKGVLPERHWSAVGGLARRWRGGPRSLESLARRHALDPAQVVRAAAAENWNALMQQSVPRPQPRRRARRLLHTARSIRMRGGRGISVAVLGPDGAGKTSLVRYLSQSLPLPTCVQYMGLTGGRLPRADALRIPGVVFAARLGIIWLRYARGLRQTMRGGIVLFDRYTLDGFVPSGMRLSPLGRASRWSQRYVCPLPDLVLLLDASGETLHARSAEYDVATLEAWRQAFAQLEGRVCVLRKLDAERPADQVRRDAAALVWQRYGELRGRKPGERR